MRADILERLDDYFRPADAGMEIDGFRRKYWWLTEYGDRLDPYYSRSELISGGQL